MRTYYHDGDVRITAEAVWVGERGFPLSEVTRAWRRTSAVAGRRIIIGVCLLLLALGLRAATNTVWWLGRLPDLARGWVADGIATTAVAGAGVLGFALVGVVAIEAAILAVEDIRGHARYRELWISLHGQRAMVVRTNDAARFDAIRRALARALDDRAGPAPPIG